METKKKDIDWVRVYFRDPFIEKASMILDLTVR